MQNLMRKAEFARRCNVDRSRVTQWCEAKQIDGTAIVGEGRLAQLDPAKALAQLRDRLSTNERCGLNGIDTKLDWLPPEVDEDDDDMIDVERNRGVMVDLADVEYAIDMIWVRSDFSVQDALKPHPAALATYMAIRPQLAAIKDRRG